jgi:hypothetical protein
LEDDIQWFASQRHPFSKTSANGVWENKCDLNPVFKDISQRVLRGYVEMLRSKKRVVVVAPKGSKNKSYLDVPGGPFTVPETEVLTGARPERW